jgi:hypothetical protein
MPEWKIKKVKNPVTGQDELGMLPVDQWAKDEVKKGYSELGYIPIGVNSPDLATVGIDVTQKV